MSILFQWKPFKFLWFTISPVASSRVNEIGSTNILWNMIDIIKITLTSAPYPLDAVDKFYTLYPISIPFVMIGFFLCGRHFFVSLKTRCFHFSSIYFLFYLCGLVTIGLAGGNVIYRANYFFISYLYFLVSGIYAAYRFVRSYRRIFISILAAAYLLYGLAFTGYYFKVYSVAQMYKYPNSYYGLPATDAVLYAQNELEVKDIYIDYITVEELLCFDLPISPYDKAEQQHEDGYGRYHFKVDDATPIDVLNAYVVHKDNQEFISQLNLFGAPYETIEYPYYYLFYFK